jgi:four helix bundle protein
MIEELGRTMVFGIRLPAQGLFIPSNIAEGYERDGTRDRSKFPTYAKGSCAELRTQIYIDMEAGAAIITIRW